MQQNQSRPKYNADAAVQLRGKTLNEAGLYDPYNMHPDMANTVIGFRLSLEICSNEPGQDYDWGNMPLHVHVLLSYFSGGLNQLRTTVNKAMWRKAYNGYRTYCREAEQNQDLMSFAN